MITLLDYGAGNVRSVINAIEYLGEKVAIVSKPEDIVSAEKLVFPGVGNFGNMMKILNEKGYTTPLKEYLQANKPFLGICLGLQALFEESEEAPNIRGLGVFLGKVKRFDTTFSVPHIGWNGIKVKQKASFLSHLKGDEKFYFVHSYHVIPKDNSITLTTTDYGYEFVSSIQKGNIIATQFHPEKSGKNGLQLLENFIRKPLSEVSCPPINSSGKTQLSKRIVACLDVRSNENGDLVVTKGDQYDVREKGKIRNLGKPVELARKYYEDGADEIVFLNITGFRDFPLEDLPMLEVLKEVSKNVFVPLTIGGGIKDYSDGSGRKYTSLEVASEYFRSGADKISIGSDAVLIAEDYLRNWKMTGNSSIEQISKVYGRQAVVISIDPKRTYCSSPKNGFHQMVKTKERGPNKEEYCWFECTVKGGREGSNIDAVTLAQCCEKLGAGEILLNSIDKDGTKSGYDLELIKAVKGAVKIPVIASSGAGNAEHFYEVFKETGVEAALGAGIFHRNEVAIKSIKEYLKSKGLEVRQ